MMIHFDPAQHPAARRQGLLSQLVTPRPIAMISTTNADGSVNVAPYSYYLPITGDPMLIGVTVGAHREDGGAPKDTWVNIARTGELVVNVTVDSMRAHIETAAIEFPPGLSEAAHVGWTPVPSQVVSHPSLAESPAHLECRVHQVVELGSNAEVFAAVHFVVAEVVAVTLDEAVCDENFRVRTTELGTVGRHGFPWFVRSVPAAMFELPRVPYREYSTQAS